LLHMESQPLRVIVVGAGESCTIHLWGIHDFLLTLRKDLRGW